MEQVKEAAEASASSRGAWRARATSRKLTQMREQAFYAETTRSSRARGRPRSPSASGSPG